MGARSCLLLVLSLTPALSEEGDPAARAVQHAQAGRFMKAILAYEKAYALSPEPKYLFAVAAAYEKLEGRCADAMLGWDRFLTVCKDCETRSEGVKRRAELSSRCGPDGEEKKPTAKTSAEDAPPEKKPQKKDRPRLTGFDHGLHLDHPKAARVAECGTCHKLGKGGKLRRRHGHRRCRGCHNLDRLQSNLLRRRGRAALRICNTCHYNALKHELGASPRLKIRRRAKAVGEPLVLATFDHGRHTRMAPCASCHTQTSGGGPTGEKKTGHSSCSASGCHGDGGMKACGTCHRLGAPRAAQGSANPVSPQLFDHARHAVPKANAKDGPCFACHTNVAVGPGEGVPRPPKAACRTCHAVDASPGVNCGQCHQQ